MDVLHELGPIIRARCSARVTTKVMHDRTRDTLRVPNNLRQQQVNLTVQQRTAVLNVGERTLRSEDLSADPPTSSSSLAAPASISKPLAL